MPADEVPSYFGPAGSTTQIRPYSLGKTWAADGCLGGEICAEKATATPYHLHMKMTCRSPRMAVRGCPSGSGELRRRCVRRRVRGTARARICAAQAEFEAFGRWRCQEVRHTCPEPAASRPANSSLRRKKWRGGTAKVSGPGI